MRILETAGVCVRDSECRDLLTRAGAQVDLDGEKVYLPGRLVEECLATAPSHFLLHNDKDRTYARHILIAGVLSCWRR